MKNVFNSKIFNSIQEFKFIKKWNELLIPEQIGVIWKEEIS